MKVTPVLLVSMLLVWAMTAVDKAWGETDEAVKKPSTSSDEEFPQTLEQLWEKWKKDGGMGR